MNVVATPGDDAPMAYPDQFELTVVSLRTSARSAGFVTDRVEAASAVIVPQRTTPTGASTSASRAVRMR